MMGEHRVQQADDAVTPLIDDVMQTEKLADVRLIEAEQRFWRCVRPAGARHGKTGSDAAP